MRVIGSAGKLQPGDVVLTPSRRYAIMRAVHLDGRVELQYLMKSKDAQGGYLLTNDRVALFPKLLEFISHHPKGLK